MLGEVTDYSWNGDRVLNRQYRVYTQLGINIPVAPDPTSNLNLWIGVDYNRAAGAVWSYLAQWQIHTHVPWPTSEFLKASQLNAQFKDVLDPLLGVQQSPAKVPDPFHLLSVKVMPNGDLDVYVEPLS